MLEVETINEEVPIERKNEMLEEIHNTYSKALETLKLYLKQRKDRCISEYKEMLEREEQSLIAECSNLYSSYVTQVEKNCLKSLHVSLVESHDFHGVKPLGEIQLRTSEDDKKLSFTFPELLSNCENSPEIANEKSNEKKKKRKEKRKKQTTVDSAGSRENVKEESCKNTHLKERMNKPFSRQQDIAQGHKLKGNDLFRQSKFDAAIDSYSQAISVCPKDNVSDLSVFYQNRAAAYEKLNQWDQVLKDCTTAINMNPTYVKALFRRSEAYKRLEKMRNAYQDYFVASSCQEKLGLDTSAQKAVMKEMISSLGRDEMYKLISNRPQRQMPSISVIRDGFRYYNYDVYYIPPSTEKRDANYLEILRLLKEEKFEPMLELCEIEITSKGTHYSKALSIRAFFKILTADNMSAREDFLKVKRLGWEEENYLLSFDAELKVTHLMTNMKTNMNLPSYDVPDKYEAIEENYEDMGKYLATVHVLKGRYFRTMGRFKEAKRAFKRAIKLDPKFFMPKSQLALCLYEEHGGHESTKLTTETEEAYHQMVQDLPDFAPAWESFCTVLGNVGRFKEANKKIDRAIALTPNIADPYVVKATNLIEHTERYDEAEELLRKALEMDPKNGNAFRCLSMMEQYRGNDAKELEYLEEAVKWVLKLDQLTEMFERREELKAKIKLSFIKRK